MCVGGGEEPQGRPWGQGVMGVGGGTSFLCICNPELNNVYKPGNQLGPVTRNWLFTFLQDKVKEIVSSQYLIADMFICPMKRQRNLLCFYACGIYSACFWKIVKLADRKAFAIRLFM